MLLYLIKFTLELRSSFYVPYQKGTNLYTLKAIFDVILQKKDYIPYELGKELISIWIEKYLGTLHSVRFVIE